MKYNRTTCFFAVICCLSLFNVELKSAVTVEWKYHGRWRSDGTDMPALVCPDSKRTEEGVSRKFCSQWEKIPVGQSKTYYEPVTIFEQVLDCVNEEVPLQPETQITFSLRKLTAIKQEPMLAMVYLAQRKRVALVDLQYPYGKKKIYMNGSLMSVAAQYTAAGHQVDIIDFNIDDRGSPGVQNTLSKSQIIGISVVGSPYFPQTAAFCRHAATQYPHAKLLLGGQVIRGLATDEFKRIFGKRAIQITGDADAEPFLGAIPPVSEAPFQPVWERMGDGRLREYIEREFALFLSQGCAFNCHFCAADKNRKEQHRQMDIFVRDLAFLMDKAKAFGLQKLECYASPLDFFQNPETVSQYMRAIADMSKQYGMPFRMRALSCMSTFLKASRSIPDFPELVHNSGLWCIGFGVDGPNKEVWKQQNKLQNDARDIVDCLNLSAEIGIRAEVLMIMGYPDNTPRQLWATVRDCYRYARRWPNTVLRPYLAKTLLPGNLGWEIQPDKVEKLIADPQQFYGLDLCALGSSVTHPHCLQRWLANLSYLSVIGGLAPFGRCATSPLFPQGTRGPIGLMAGLINRHMPFDR